MLQRQKRGITIVGDGIQHSDLFYTLTALEQGGIDLFFMTRDLSFCRLIRRTHPV